MIAADRQPRIKFDDSELDAVIRFLSLEIKHIAPCVSWLEFEIPKRRAKRKREESRELATAWSQGSGLVDHSQKMTVAARATAEKKAVGHRS